MWRAIGLVSISLSMCSASCQAAHLYNLWQQTDQNQPHPRPLPEIPKVDNAKSQNRPQPSQPSDSNLPPSQQPRQSAAELASRRVQELAKNLRWQEASLELDQIMSNCSDAESDDAKACRTLVYSTRAYVNLTQSVTLLPSSEEAKKFLQAAADSYQNALRNDPNNGPLLNNLAFVLNKLGRREEAREALEKAMSVDFGRAAVYAVALGDSYVVEKNWAEALNAYKRAAFAAPESSLPSRRILDLYGRSYKELSQGQRVESLSFFHRWETTAPQLARAGYEFSLGQAASPGVDREYVLLRWTLLLTRQHALDSIAVDDLGKVAAPEVKTAIAELGTYLRRPWNPPTAPWWLEQAKRRTVLARVSLFWGRENQTEQSAALTEQCWLTGLQILPQNAERGFVEEIDTQHGFFEDIGAMQVSLDLRLELATLYLRVHELDSNGEKVEKLVGQLYMEKIRAIALGDVDAQQRYHTVLGRLFAERGQWQGSGAANAIYQLSHALEVAEDRFRRGGEVGFYQPLPELRSQLAQGYWKIGEHSAAAKTAVEAAMAYLDSDDLDSAGRWVGVARDYGTPEAALNTLRALIDFRRMLVTSGPEANSHLKEISTQSHPWLYAMDFPDAEDFLKRQRFKIFSDIAEPSSADKEEWNAAPAVDAFRLVLEGEGTPLIGAADLYRWEKVRGIVLNSLSVDVSPTQFVLVPADRETSLTMSFVLRKPISFGCLNLQRNEGGQAPCMLFADERNILMTLYGEMAPTIIEVQLVERVASSVARTLGTQGIQKYHAFLRVGRQGIAIKNDAPEEVFFSLTNMLRPTGIYVFAESKGGVPIA